MSRVEFSLSLSRKRRALFSKWVDHVTMSTTGDQTFAGLEPAEIATVKTILCDLRDVMQTSLPTDWFQRAQHYMTALRMALQAHGEDEDKLYPYLSVLLLASKLGGMDKVAEHFLAADDGKDRDMLAEATEEVREMGTFLRLVIAHKPQGDDAAMAEIKESVDAMLEDVEKADFAERLAAQFNLVVH